MRRHTWRANLRASRRVVLGSCLLICACLSAGGPAGASASSLPILSLSATPTSITVSGAEQAGAVNVVTSATGKLKEAAAVLFLLKPGVSVAEVLAYLDSPGRKDINTSSRYGSIVYDCEVTPGKASEAQTTLQPGQYLALLAEGEGSPKVRSAFTVSASASPAAIPVPQATVRSIEFGFHGPSTLKDGELVRFENEGFVIHMDYALPVRSRAAARTVVADLLLGRERGIGRLLAGAPVSFAGPHSTGAYQQETITARPGWYVEVCFMNTQDGRPHTRLGMERIIRITK